jgi:uncharacterized coiled-coil protein SlyX
MNTIKAILFSIIVISFSSCGTSDSSGGDMKTIDSLSSVLAEKESEINKNLDLLDNIDAALKAASPAEGVEVSDPEKVKAIDKEIYDKISTIRKQLESDNVEIEKLNKDLAKAKESASYRKDLLNKVSSRLEDYEKENALLKQQIASETQDISNLTAELAAQGIQISQLQASLGEMNANIVELKAELNLAYYMVGTKKDLKRDSVIVKKGVGGAITLNNKLDHSKFIKWNKSSDKTISLTGFKKVELVPQRPESSYQFKKENDLIVQINITDTDKFWEVSDYLVIVVK